MMTYPELFRAYIVYSLEHPEQRKGQALFNYLYENEQTRVFANEIHCTKLDPFYNDSVIGDVLARLCIRMVEAEESA